MRLYYFPTSPYARKVRCVILELKIDEQCELVIQDPRDGTGGFFEKSPLAKIPVLETDAGNTLIDSPVICEYLNATFGGSLFPADGQERWAAVKAQALGDGLMDLLVPLRQEFLRPAATQSEELIERYQAAVNRTLLYLDRRAEPDCREVTIGDLAIGCALGYLDFRFSDWNWRGVCPALNDWFAAVSSRPSFTRTQPF